MILMKAGIKKTYELFLLKLVYKFYTLWDNSLQIFMQTVHVVYVFQRNNILRAV